MLSLGERLELIEEDSEGEILEDMLGLKLGLSDDETLTDMLGEIETDIEGEIDGLREEIALGLGEIDGEIEGL